MAKPKTIDNIGKILLISGLVIMLIAIGLTFLAAPPPITIRILIAAVGVIDIMTGLLVIYAAKRL